MRPPLAIGRDARAPSRPRELPGRARRARRRAFSFPSNSIIDSLGATKTSTDSTDIKGRFHRGFYEGRGVWFVTGSQDLYGENAGAGLRTQSARLCACSIPTASRADRVEPILNSDSIKRAMLEASADDRVLSVISWMHTFGTKMWIRGLTKCHCSSLLPG